MNTRRILLIIALFLCAIKYFSDQAMGQVSDVETTDLLHIERPDDISDEIKATVDIYEVGKNALRHELRNAIDDLNNPTEEDIRVTIIAFREENADRIATQKRLSATIRELIQELHSDRLARPDRPDLPPEIVVLRDEFKANQFALIQERNNFIESIKDLSEKERADAIEAFREEHRLRHQEQKELRRQIRDQARDNLGSDRRPDNS